MEIKIFDVSHGFCALLVADNGNVALFDAGHNNLKVTGSGLENRLKPRQ